MGVEVEKEVTITHVCDRCGKEVERDSERRPQRWADLELGIDRYDYHGHAVASGDQEYYVCNNCSRKFLEWVKMEEDE